MISRLALCQIKCKQYFSPGAKDYSLKEKVNIYTQVNFFTQNLNKLESTAFCS